MHFSIATSINIDQYFIDQFFITVITLLFIIIWYLHEVLDVGIRNSKILKMFGKSLYTVWIFLTVQKKITQICGYEYIKTVSEIFSKSLSTCCPSKIIVKRFLKLKINFSQNLSSIHSWQETLFWPQDWYRRKWYVDTHYYMKFIRQIATWNGFELTLMTVGFQKHKIIGRWHCV